MSKWVVVSAVVLVAVVGLWLYVGFLPLRSYHNLSDAAAYGDSFGFANSLFSSFAFAFVAFALLLQIKELRDSAQTQADQGRMQLEQMKIAERTVLIQETMRQDAVRQLAMEAFLKISRDVVTFKHAFTAWHPDNNRLTNSQLVDQETDRRLKKEYFEAYTNLRSNCLSVGLLFDRQGDALGKAIQDLYDAASSYFQLGASQRPSAAQCENVLDQHIRLIEQAMRPLWESLGS